MFNPQAFDNSQPDGAAVLEISARSEPGLPRRFVPLKRTLADGEVIGPLAAMHVTHVYGYSGEQCDQVLEALYRFPLPGDAAVTGVIVTFGDVEIKAELRERAEAQAEYTRAREEGRQATLLTRETPSVFTLLITGIKPDEDVTVETSYVQLASVEGDGWTLRIPLTTAPRYVRGDEVGTTNALAQPLGLLRDPGHLFSLDLLMPGAATIESPTHHLEISDEDGRPRVRLAERQVAPDRDLVLRWRMEQEEARPHLRVLTHEDPVAGHLYFMALVAPPARPDAASVVPREITLLVDHSGSMEGPKWAAADWAVKKFLSALSQRDSFALGLFHSQTWWFAREMRRARAETVELACQFLDAHRDSGGTELGVALEAALSLEPGEGIASRHIIVITDAQVSDESRILRLAEGGAREPGQRRISVLCIDSAPNSYLAQQLALRGGGVAHFLTSDPKEQDIATALDEILADWAQPVMTGLRLETGGSGMEASGREVLPSGAIDLGDLPAGRAIWVAGRLPLSDLRAPEFRVRCRDDVVASATGEPASGMSGCPALKALFGAWRINGLEQLANSSRSDRDLATELARLGYDPAKELKAGRIRDRVYAENVRREASETLRSLLIRESLNYGLLTSATGFVASRREKGKTVEETVVVAGALPHGWDARFLSAASPLRAPSSTLSEPLAASEAAARFDAVSHIPTFLRRRMSMQAPAGTQPVGFRPPAAQLRTHPSVAFSGAPSFHEGVAVLLDATIQESRVFARLAVRFPEGAAPALAPDLYLLVYTTDQASPAVRVRLADLMRQSGERPVNLFVPAGGRIRVVLEDRKGEWPDGNAGIEVLLE